VYGGKLTRYDRRTGQSQDVMPPQNERFRALRTAPVLFSPLDTRTLFFAANTLWKTTTGGQTWTEMSPDLARQTWSAPANVGTYRGAPAAQPSARGVIYTIAPSYVDANTIWAGTDDGLIHVTRDAGANWRDVTPAALQAWAKVSIIEASHFDANIAYAAINTLRLDDLRPHVLRTKDGGRTWTEITRGLPDGGVINTVREDPYRRGMLFAGSEQAVSVSFDDGESWQSLRLNMPATSIRDLVIKDDDLVAGTHGRGFWILDNISPLRQVTPDTLRAPAFLFRPAAAWRFRWNKNTDTPPPPDEPAAPNPPDGVAIDYNLGPAVSGPVTLEILEATGQLIRTFSSGDPEDPPVPGRNIPDYWLRPVRHLAATPGPHRFVWDGRYAPPAPAAFSYPIAAVVHNTPKEPRGAWVLPGQYVVRLTVGDRMYRQPVTVKMDPRVKTSVADLTAQFKLSRRLDDAMRQIAEAPRTPANTAALAAALEPLGDLFTTIQAADAKPTAAQEAAVEKALAKVTAALAIK
jgi:hypothetical protein